MTPNRINREDILAAILNHKKYFFKFIDMINTNESALQFPMAAYLDFYDKVVSEGGNSLKDILSVDALVEANVFVSIDGMTSMVTLSKEVYNILVWIDVSRKKQLDSQPFESHRQDIVRLARELATLPIDSLDFKETYSFFYDKLSDIQGDISENVRVLDYRVQEIADMYKSRELGSMETGLDEIYDKAHHIYNRNIMPCLEFINPNLELKGTTNLSQTLKDLEVYFESIGEVDRARALQFRVRAIFCYYKDIGDIADNINSYLTSLSQERGFFLSMEKAWGMLQESLVPLRHGKTHKRKLHSGSEIFKIADTFDGLGHHKRKFEAKLNLSPTKGVVQFENYYEVIQEKPLRSDSKRLKPTPVIADIEEERSDIILNYVLRHMHVPDKITDIHNYVWTELKSFMPDAKIMDLLYALEYFIGGLEDKWIFQRDSERCRISDTEHYFDSLIWDYEVGQHHGE